MSRIPRIQVLLFVGFSLFLGGYLFKAHEEKRLASLQDTLRQTEEEIAQIKGFETLWNTKDLSGKLQRVRKSIPSQKVKHFTVKGKRVQADLVELQGPQLNRILQRIGSLPLQVESVRIQRQGKMYRMECRCKW